MQYLHISTPTADSLQPLLTLVKTSMKLPSVIKSGQFLECLTDGWCLKKDFGPYNSVHHPYCTDYVKLGTGARMQTDDQCHRLDVPERGTPSAYCTSMAAEYQRQCREIIVCLLDSVWLWLRVERGF